MNESIIDLEDNSNLISEDINICIVNMMNSTQKKSLIETNNQLLETMGNLVRGNKLLKSQNYCLQYEIGKIISDNINGVWWGLLMAI